LKGTRNLSLSYLLGTIFVLFSAVAGTGWLYSPDVFLMLVAQSWSSDFLDVAFGFLSAFGSLEVTGALLLTLSAGLSLGGRQRLAGRLLLAFLATGLLEYLLKQFLPVLPVPTASPARRTSPRSSSPITRILTRADTRSAPQSCSGPSTF
jgi:hypothetical protein